MTTLRGRSGHRLVRKMQAKEQLDAESCHLPHPYPTLHFNEPHLQGARRKVPSLSTSTWQLLGDTNSWWKVELGMRRREKEWQTERMKEGGGGGSWREVYCRCKAAKVIDSVRDEEYSWWWSSWSLGKTHPSLDASPCWEMKDRRRDVGKVRDREWGRVGRG